ncbi:MAG: hypothetical protein WBJ21_07335 [Burkholderiaceae bacterium]
MAYRIDEQFLGILHSQFTQALEKLGTTEFSLEGKAAVEVVFYLLSFCLRGSDMLSMGTPGMHAVGLSVESESNGNNGNIVPTNTDTDTAGVLRAVIILSFLTVKWSTLKLQEMSSLHGWFAYPSVRYYCPLPFCNVCLISVTELFTCQTCDKRYNITL